MKRLSLFIQMIVEAMFGVICIAALLLLLEIWKGALPQPFLISFLGMPQHHHTSAGFYSVNVITLDGLLSVIIVLVTGALCFKDVFRIVRRLRVSHH